MASKIAKTVSHRRKRQGRTDYKKRLKFLESGMPRAVVRKLSRSIIVQIAEFDAKGDKNHVLVSSTSLKKQGWRYSCSNMPAAYLTGLFAGKKAMSKKISDVVVDFGLQNVKAGSKLYAAVKGLMDAGVNTRTKDDVLPDDERIKGAHISSYSRSLRESEKELHDKRFSGYIRSGADPEKVADSFAQLKEKIMKS